MKFLLQMIITSRPLGWLIFILSYLGGVFAGKQYFNTQQIVTLIIIGPILSFVIYTFNDIFDYESDVINERKELAIMGGVLDKKYWPAFKILSYFLSLIILFLPVMFQNWLGLICVICGLVVGIVYSIPPIRLKTRLGGDVFACCFGFLALFF